MFVICAAKRSNFPALPTPPRSLGDYGCQITHRYSDKFEFQVKSNFFPILSVSSIFWGTQLHQKSMHCLSDIQDELGICFLFATLAPSSKPLVQWGLLLGSPSHSAQCLRWVCIIGSSSEPQSAKRLAGTYSGVIGMHLQTQKQVYRCQILGVFVLCPFLWLKHATTGYKENRSSKESWLPKP